MVQVNNVFISAVTQDNISRKDSIAWVNDKLKSHFTKVEELSSGAAYCQLTHFLFKDRMNLKKVKFNPRSEPEVLNNWKILTTSWKNIGIDKPVEVEKLKKGKFQDNFEFLQWFHKFFNANLPDSDEYDAIEARFGEELPALSSRPGVGRIATTKATPSMASKPKTSAVSTVATSVTPSYERSALGMKKEKASTPGQKTDSLPTTSALQRKLEELQQENETLHELLRGVEQERDFYFAKLRKIEDLCTDSKPTGDTVQIELILDILYKEDEKAEMESSPQRSEDDDLIIQKTSASAEEEMF